jgi:hypothetical protein
MNISIHKVKEKCEKTLKKQFFLYNGHKKSTFIF